MTAAPAGEKKADAENTDPAGNAAAEAKKAAAKPAAKKAPAKKTTTRKSTSGSPKEGAALPQGQADEAHTPTVAAPNQPIEPGLAQVTTKAADDEISDPAGNVTKVAKATRAPRAKKDPFQDIDHTKLPVAASVGQVTAVIELYAGNPVLSISLAGWVGEAPVKILAKDADEVLDAIATLRKELS